MNLAAGAVGFDSALFGAMSTELLEAKVSQGESRNALERWLNLARDTNYKLALAVMVAAAVVPMGASASERSTHYIDPAQVRSYATSTDWLSVELEALAGDKFLDSFGAQVIEAAGAAMGRMLPSDLEGKQIVDWADGLIGSVKG